MDEPQVVHQDISYHVDLRELRSLAVGNGVVAGPCSEENIRQAVDDEPVHFLRHVDIEGARAGSDMCEADAMLLRHDSYSHR